MSSERVRIPDPAAMQRAAMESTFVPDSDLAEHGYERGDFWIGRTLTEVPYPVGMGEDHHLLTCAGTRAGKGVGCIVPNLLEFTGSAVVIDPKGELADLTADYRRRVLGHKVIVLDPTRASQNVPDDLYGTYNPLKALNSDAMEAVGNAQSLAEGLVVPRPDSKEPFWDQSAIQLLKGLLLYMATHYFPDRLNLMALRETASVGDWDLYQQFLSEVLPNAKDGDDIPKSGFDLLVREMLATDSFGGIVREVGATINDMGDTTRGNVLGNARIHLDFLGDPRLQSVLVDGDDPDRTFTLDEFRRQDRPLTVYLCLPVDMMYQQGRWLRLIVSQITTYLQRTGPQFQYGRDKPVLMMLDEFFQLGPMPSIINTLTYAAGAGLRLWLIVQDINQLKINYPGSAWETIMGACGIKQFFGINDLTTAKYISEMIGDCDLVVETVTVTETENRSVGESEANTKGTSGSQAVGVTKTEGYTRNVGWSVADAISNSRAISSGWSETSSYGGSTSVGTQIGASRSLNRLPGSTSDGLNQLTNRGGSDSVNLGKNESSGKSYGVSRGMSGGETFTQGHTLTRSDTGGEAFSESTARSTTRTDGWNEGTTHTRNLTSSMGANYGTSYAVQSRRVLRPDQLWTAFNRQNLVQLVHVRDWGPMMLYRTPFYADPDFRQSLETYEYLRVHNLTATDAARLIDQGEPLPSEVTGV